MNGAFLFTKLCQLLASCSVCKWGVQPCDSYLKERFLSLIDCLFFVIRISRFCSSYFFCYPHFFTIRIFLSAFSHPHPPSAGIRSAFYRHPFSSAMQFVKVTIPVVAQEILFMRNENGLPGSSWNTSNYIMFQFSHVSSTFVHGKKYHETFRDLSIV